MKQDINISWKHVVNTILFSGDFCLHRVVLLLFIDVYRRSLIELLVLFSEASKHRIVLSSLAKSIQAYCSKLGPGSKRTMAFSRE